MISKYSDDRWTRSVTPQSASVSARAGRITQQFREHHDMTYELDCSGVPLVLRGYFPNDAAESSFRIDACCGRPTPEASWISTSARSKGLALQKMAQSFCEAATGRASKLDWDGVAQAMPSVRAI